MPAWLVPALFAGASALFGGISKKRQRDEENRTRAAAWADYQTKYRAYVDQQNKRREILRWYVDKKGGRERLGPLYDQIFAPLDYSSVPGGSAPKVQGSFWGDALGSALGQVPGYISQFSGPQAPRVDPSIQHGLMSLYGQGQQSANYYANLYGAAR